ncbi:hypothetical protein ACWDUN_10570 [Mycobacterium sp. NPDC003323]
MEISARSYFTTGMAFTAASAIALTPLVVTPTADRTIALPAVSTADVRLAAVIDPADVDRLIAALRAGLADVNAGIDSAETFATDTLADVLAEAERLNTGLWTRLIAAAGTGALGTLVTTIGNYSQASLAMTSASINGAASAVVPLPGDITDIIGSTLIGSLNTALYAITDVINNPFKLASYTGLLAGVVNIIGDALVAQDPTYPTGLLPGVGGSGLFGTVLSATVGGVINVIGLGSSGLTGQVNLAVDTLNGALDGIAQQSGSELVAGLVGLIQGLALNPVKIINNTGVLGGLVNIGFPVIAAVDPIVNAASEAVVGVQTGLNVALDAIGNAPLELESYTTALGGLFNGGFDVTGAGISAGTSALALPGSVLAGVTTTTAALVTALTTNLAETVAGLLTQVGLDRAAELTLELAGSVNYAVNWVRDVVATEVIGGINNAITNAGATLTNLNENAREVINDLLGYNPVSGLQPQPAGARTAESDTLEGTGPAEGAAEGVADAALVGDTAAPEPEAATAPVVSEVSQTEPTDPVDEVTADDDEPAQSDGSEVDDGSESTDSLRTDSESSEQADRPAGSEESESSGDGESEQAESAADSRAQEPAGERTTQKGADAGSDD